MAGSQHFAGATSAQLTALLDRGAKFLGKAKPQNALRAFDEAIMLDPANAEAYCGRGSALAELGQLEAALANYDRAVALRPELSEVHDFRGVILVQLGLFDAGLESVERAIAVAPANLNALSNRANILRDMGRLDEAVTAFDTLIAMDSAFAPAHYMRALTLATLGRHDAALEGFDRAIALDPQNIEALCNRGTALLFIGRADEAIESFRSALALDPTHLATLWNLGETLAGEGRREEAERCYRRCLEIEPGHVDALLSLGSLLVLQHRFDEAGRCYQRALTVDDRNVAGLHGLASVLTEFGQLDNALMCYDHLLAIDPEDAAGYQKRGLLMLDRHDYPEAIRCLDRAGELDPALALPASRLHAAMHLSQWEGFDDRLEAVRQAVAHGVGDSLAFPLLALADDPALQLESSRVFARSFATVVHEPLPAYRRHDRIRLGYFSADFNHHATMQLFAETLEAHDRDRFELAGFWFGRGKNDSWKARAEAAFDHFVDVRLKDDATVAQLAREMEIDIAIDLKGYTQQSRFGIFARRAAPIQVGYLGYPGTSGAECIDYLLADSVVVHPEHRRHFSEAIVSLPGSYQANGRLHPISRSATRRELGLPEEAFVFCCFNQNYKITPAMFEVWMRILRQLDASVLWLWVDRDVARANLLRSAERFGIAPERIRFAKSEHSAYHLDRLQVADLFLDTHPCNAHTTASDALRAGLPLLTLAGKSFASRVAASLLHAVDLPELVTESPGAYEAFAVALANDRERMDGIRARLAANRDISSLFDPLATARKLERAYVELYQRHRAGMAPEDFPIPA